jgi:hypothetical protein
MSYRHSKLYQIHRALLRHGGARAGYGAVMINLGCSIMRSSWPKSLDGARGESFDFAAGQVVI